MDRARLEQARDQIIEEIRRLNFWINQLNPGELSPAELQGSFLHLRRRYYRAWLSVICSLLAGQQPCPSKSLRLFDAKHELWLKDHPYSAEDASIPRKERRRLRKAERRGR